MSFNTTEYTVTEGEERFVTVIVQGVSQDIAPFSVLFQTQDGTAIGKGG